MSELDKLAGQTVLVIGDVMLDEYIRGNVRRISPEAPVPVVDQQNISCFPGGAGNVAANIASLGAQVYVVGGVGDDHQADSLRQMLAQLRVNVSGLIPFAAYPTTTKTRVVAHNQHILRIDREHIRQLDTEEEISVLSVVDNLIGHVNVCILSDYAKGVLTPRICNRVIQKAQANNIPVVVDPKGIRFDKYIGAAVITPNLDEAKIAASAIDGAINIDCETNKGIETLGMILAAHYQSAFLVTRGEKGMSLIQQGQPSVHISAQARQVYDVTGAGDTVIAVLALGLAAGLGLETSARLANSAAGTVVSKLGTATVSLEELQQVGQEICESAS